MIADLLLVMHMVITPVDDHDIVVYKNGRMICQGRGRQGLLYICPQRDL